METNKHPIIAYHYFSYVSAECFLLYENGHYYGCIALCQSLAEAYAKFLCERGTGKDASEKFLANIHRLENVQPDVREPLKTIFGGQERNDFHHLNKTIPTDYQQLKTIATRKINLLNEVEKTIFDFQFTEGAIVVKYPMYWDKANPDQIKTYLRLD